MTVIIIAAVDLAGGIGLNNSLPWYYPEDLKLFKRLTLNHSIIMGRKTFESLGRPLPNREHHIISSQNLILPDSCNLHHSLDSAIKLSQTRNTHTFIVGGARIFADAFAYADIIFLTKIQRIFTADTFFPKIPKEFKCVSQTALTEDLNFEVYRPIEA